MIYVWDKFAHIHLCFASVCIIGDSPDTDGSHQRTKLFSPYVKNCRRQDTQSKEMTSQGMMIQQIPSEGPVNVF